MKLQAYFTCANRVLFYFFVEFETTSEFVAVTGHLDQIGLTVFAWVGGVYDTGTGTQYVWNQGDNAIDPDMYLVPPLAVSGYAIYMNTLIASSASSCGALTGGVANSAVMHYQAMCEEYP